VPPTVRDMFFQEGQTLTRPASVLTDAGRVVF
jgi:hypothetical protein